MTELCQNEKPNLWQLECIIFSNVQYPCSNILITYFRSTYKSFGFTDVFQKSIFYPFLVILVLMFLLQFSGQGAVTFYTALIFEEAESSVDPNDCALVIGVTYFLSSILGNYWVFQKVLASVPKLS